MIKAGAQRLAAELGLMLVAPDTSPRPPRLPGDDASWDFGLGAGFYVDATADAVVARTTACTATSRASCPSWSTANFPALAERQGIFGHSMGGHGALRLRAAQPAALPLACRRSRRSRRRCAARGAARRSRGYLGADRGALADYDASRARLTRDVPRSDPDRPGRRRTNSSPSSCKPELFAAACAAPGRRSSCACAPATTTATTSSRRFMADHLAWHASALNT